MDSGTRRKRQEERDPKSLGVILLLFGTVGLAIEGFALYIIFDGHWEELSFSDYLFPGLTLVFIFLGLYILIFPKTQKEKELKSQILCPKCSHFNDRDSIHCENCGTKLNEYS